MSLLEAIVLGIVQGVTEFLPISSDGHLALGTQLMGREPDLSFVVFLHGATLIAMFAYFWRDVVTLATSLLPRNKDRLAAERRMAFLIIAGTFVTGIVALALEPVVEPMSGSPIWVGVWFLSTALVLAAGEALSGKRPATTSADRLSYGQTAFVAFMQGLAVLPGLSRSGSTIASGMLAGLSREHAARFSFLLGMPIITAAAAKDLLDLTQGTSTLPPAMVSASGFIAAAASGYLAIYVLLRLVKTTRLYGFAAYTAVLGAILLVTAAA